jgi:hypothetical protein
VTAFRWVALPILAILFVPLQSLAASGFAVSHTSGSDLLEIRAEHSGHHVLDIDDAAGFRVPLVRQSFSGTALQLHGTDLGLIPGILYYLRLDHSSAVQTMLWSLNPDISEPGLNCQTLQTTWRQNGRFYVGIAYSQLKWDDAAHQWNPVVPAVPIGEALYNTEFYLRPALSAARRCADLDTLDEVAKYYLAMLAKTETLGALLKRSNVTQESRDRMSSSDLAARTFTASFGREIGEGELYNSQWLHPAALLVRLISQLPPEERTPAMRNFVTQLTPFIVREQLLRFLFDQQEPLLGGRANRGRVAHWDLAMQGLQGRVRWDSAMSDIDLWLISSAAEMVGAQANDPQLVSITPQDLARLHQAIDTGIRFFQSKRTEYPDTKNFKGQQVGSASYFNGEYDGLEEMKGSAVAGQQIPSPDTALARPGASWDIGHMYRVAIFLRALYENRKATGNNFAQLRDIQLVVNQYLYKVFNGDYSLPLFHNNFDGSDGWFRVGYNGPGYGQPPSAYCDMHNPMRLCMTPGNIVAWAELDFANPDLERLQQVLVRIAFDENPASQAFLNRYYFWQSPFGLIVSEGKKVCSGAFYAIAAENAAKLATGPAVTAPR